MSLSVENSQRVLKSAAQGKQMLYFCVETIVLMYFNTFKEYIS